MITSIFIAALAALAVLLRFRAISRRARRRGPVEYRDGQVVVEGMVLGKAARGATKAELQAMVDQTLGKRSKPQ